MSQDLQDLHLHPISWLGLASLKFPQTTLVGRSPILRRHHCSSCEIWHSSALCVSRNQNVFQSLVDPKPTISIRTLWADDGPRSARECKPREDNESSSGVLSQLQQAATLPILKVLTQSGTPFAKQKRTNSLASHLNSSTLSLMTELFFLLTSDALKGKAPPSPPQNLNNLPSTLSKSPLWTEQRRAKKNQGEKIHNQKA